MFPHEVSAIRKLISSTLTMQVLIYVELGSLSYLLSYNYIQEENGGHENKRKLAL